MRFLYQRGKNARRRVMHLTSFDPRTGQPTMEALCGMRRPFDTTCNLPLGLRTCKRCRQALHESDGGQR